MQGFWWKLPVLRGLSPLRRGLVEAFWVTLVGSLGVLPLTHIYASRPSEALLTSIAQVGATLLVAYGVEISWFLKESRKRGTDRENWVGIASGVGLSGVLGIGCALAIGGTGGDFTLIQEFALAWSIISVSLLGLLAALGPLAVYEWSHTVHTEYPDD